MEVNYSQSCGLLIKAKYISRLFQERILQKVASELIPMEGLGNAGTVCKTGRAGDAKIGPWPQRGEHPLKKNSNLNLLQNINGEKMQKKYVLIILLGF